MTTLLVAIALCALWGHMLIKCAVEVFTQKDDLPHAERSGERHAVTSTPAVLRHGENL